jgi:L-rhamnose mutarotase
MSYRIAQALDLVEDDALILEYEKHHRQVWPEVLSHLRNSGILMLDIYRLGNRLFMIMEVSPEFNPNFFSKSICDNAVVNRWEELMWHYQRRTPWTKMNEKWTLMEPIFSLKENS